MVAVVFLGNAWVTGSNDEHILMDGAGAKVKMGNQERVVVVRINYMGTTHATPVEFSVQPKPGEDPQIQI